MTVPYVPSLFPLPRTLASAGPGCFYVCALLHFSSALRGLS